MLEKIKQKLGRMFGLDLRSLAFMRVCFGLILLVDLLQRVIFIKANYTDTGVFPRTAFLSWYQNSWVFSLHLLSGKWQIEMVLFLVAAAFALMLIVGYKTTLATIASWVMLNSLQIRNPLILHGGDDVMKLALFWAMFLPWGKVFSVDSVLAAIKGKRRNSMDFWHISGGAIAFTLQIAFIYWFTAIIKSYGPEWRDGTAAYFALSLQQFAMPLGSFILRFPPFLVFSTYGVLILEALGPFLFFSPVFTGWARLIGVLFFVLLHAVFGLGLHLGLFPFICMAALSGLLPALFWDKLGVWLGKRKATHLTVYYDDECGFCKKTIAFIMTFCAIPGRNILPASENKLVFARMVEQNSWVIVDRDTRYHTGFEGFKAIAAASPILFVARPLLDIPFINAFGEWLYARASSHHTATCLPEMPRRPSKNDFRHTSPIAKTVLNTIAIALIAYVFLWNIMTVAPRMYAMPADMQNVGIFLRLDQYWNLFAPSPWRDDGWYVIPGQLRDGQTVDIYRNGAPVSYDKPSDVAATYTDTRWRKYLLNLWIASYSQYRQYYAQYLCRSWNASHPYDQQITNLQIIYVLDRVQPDYQPRTVQPTAIWQGNCQP